MWCGLVVGTKLHRVFFTRNWGILLLNLGVDIVLECNHTYTTWRLMHTGIVIIVPCYDSIAYWEVWCIDLKLCLGFMMSMIRFCQCWIQFYWYFCYDMKKVLLMLLGYGTICYSCRRKIYSLRVGNWIELLI